MKKILYVAAREFVATVTTKGFIFGVLLTPTLVVFMSFLIPRIANETPPKIEGQVAISDPTGQIADTIEKNLVPEQFLERRRKALLSRPGWPGNSQDDRKDKSSAGKDIASELTPSEMPQISVKPLSSDAEIEHEKELLKVPLAQKQGSRSACLAVIVVHPDATKPDPEGTAKPKYDLFVRSRLDDRLIGDFHAVIQNAIGSARLRSTGLDAKTVEALTTVMRAETRAITPGGEQKNSVVFNSVLPIAFNILLLISVLTSGQYLLTTTIEEKSNRVVEVLLSAVSPMQLMTGKILGQMAIGLLILALYAGLGIAALTSFAMMGLLNPMLLIFLFLFFLLAYLTIAAMMAAIGSAVSELRDAQGLMMPMMMVLMIPWLLMMPISRDPNSLLAIVLSFIPPISSFVVVLRMASSSPPPFWQIGAAIVVGIAGAYASLRFAAKVFRVGLLMFGKPPSIGTLIRWARMS